MIEKMGVDLSRSLAKEFGETRGRTVSRIIADKTGMSMDGVHLVMILGVMLIYLGSRQK